VRLFLEQAVDRTQLLIALCQQMSVLVTTPPAEQRLLAEWRNLLHTLGRQVTVHSGMAHAGAATESTDIFSGRAIAVTADGDLVVEDRHGQRRTFSAGDVSLRQ
jgi:biotin-(acetyl-CoA carboxylase) ligase